MAGMPVRRARRNAGRKWGSERYDRDSGSGKYRKSVACEACGKPAGPNYWSASGNFGEGLTLCHRVKCPANAPGISEAAIRALCIERQSRPNPMFVAPLLAMLARRRDRQRAIDKRRSAIHRRIDAEAALASVAKSRDMRRLLGRRSAIVRCDKCWKMTTVILGEKVAGEHLHVRPNCKGEAVFMDVGDPPKFKVKG